MTLPAGTRLGPYEIVAPLGAGGMGEVYRARDTRLDRMVALKVLPEGFFEDEERKSRFEREARLLAALSHPNIAVIYAFEEIPGFSGSPCRHLLSMELLEGESVREKLDAPLPPKKVVEYAVQVAHGLAAAHEKGIVHRDIKPENLFVSKDGHVKILDFGIAKLRGTREEPGGGTETPTESATQPGTAIGTVAYMSPEQVRGSPVDARSDLFSLGVVLYEMLSGKRPFQRETAAETMTAILREGPEDLSATSRAIPPVLEKIVRHCLEKDPSVRMQSARELIFALETLSGLSSEASARPALPWTSRLRGRKAAFAGGAVLVAALVAGALWLRSRGARPAAAGAPSMVALPCKVHGAPEAAYLTDAIPGTISTLLAGVAGLETKVPPSSFEVEKVKGDLSKIAEAFRVENLLLTTLTAQGDRLVLNVQLVDAATRRVKWGKQYQGPLRDFNDLARQAADGVRVALSPAASPVPTSPASSEVELAFQEGRHVRNRYIVSHKSADFDLALRAFTRALEVDRSSARVPAEIARLNLLRHVFSGEDKWAREAESWARRALDLDPESGVAWAARTWVLNYVGEDSDLEKAIEYGLKAVRYAPWDAWAYNSIAPTVSNPGSELLALAENDTATVKALEAPLFDLVSGKRSGFCVKCKINFAAYMVAPALTRIGRKDDALRILLRSIEVGIPPSYDFLLLEPDFQGLRSDPRFAKVLDEARHGALRTARCLEGIRARGELPAYLEEPFTAFLKLLNEKGTRG